MSNLIGKSLGLYRILEPIGAGGMATVYKAYQPNMDRCVAVKVLPPHLSQDEQFTKRFQREAKAIALLEHPHILPIYDYGMADDITYIAMRYVDAGTLKQHIAQGPMALNEIGRIIGQIGSALDYAHRMGVIHRDVKPANVMIDAEGNTYLTDFGLARMMEASDQLTASGVGVGTPAYMSPEQGQGIKVDHRSDIYSLGVVLYEMVTGHVPYEAETPMAVVLKHISEPLPLPRAIAPNVPEPVERVILKALAKDPAHRYQTAGEMVQALTIALRKVAPEAPQQPVEDVLAIGKRGKGREDVSLVTRIQRTWQRPRGRAMLIGGASVAVAALVLVLSQLPGQVQIVGEQKPNAAPQATATSAAVAAVPTAPATAKATTMSTPMPAILSPSPAPTKPCRTVYGDHDKEYDLFVRDCDGSNLRRLTVHRAGGSDNPSWSPDGQRIVFDATYGAERWDAGIYLINADGSNQTLLIAAPGPGGFGNPAWSPDGERIAYMDGCNIKTIRLDGSDVVTVVKRADLMNHPGDPEMCAYEAVWSPDSQRLAIWASQLAADDFPGPYERRVAVVNADGTGLIDVASFQMKAEAGATVYWSPDGRQVAYLVWEDNKARYVRYLVNADGSSEPAEIDSIPDSWSQTHWPEWDRDAQTTPCRIAYEQDGDIYVKNCDGSDAHRVTFDKAKDQSPAWSPDGKRLAFSSERDREKGTPNRLYLVDADGYNLTQLTHPGDKSDLYPALSPGGSRVAFAHDCSLAITTLDAGIDFRLIVPESGTLCVGEPEWSPDARRLVFVNWNRATTPSAEQPGRDVYVVNIDGSGLQKLGYFDAHPVWPAWSPDGAQIGVTARDKNGADKFYLLNADGSGTPEAVSSIPNAWHAWYWPQWGGEAKPAAPYTEADTARAFAEPILKAVANRAPDMQDDFSDPGSGWEMTRWDYGEAGYLDGEYYILAKPKPEGSSCSGVKPNLEVSDFVFEIDLRAASGEAGHWGVTFRLGQEITYTAYDVSFHTSIPDDALIFEKFDASRSVGLQTANHRGYPNKPIREGNQVQIIARGPRSAVYVNGEPLWSIYETSLDSGLLSLYTCITPGKGPFQGRFDNFKLWNLANVPGLP